MKTLIGVVVAVIAVFLLPLAALLAVVVIDEDASAAENGGGNGSGGGLRNVPVEFIPWILKADESCSEPEIAPALLASQLWAESKFKTSRGEATSHVGAQGPAQFMPGTWATWGRDSDGNGEASPWDIGDAVMAQGRFMCSLLKQAKSSGYGDDPRALALAGYNAGWGRVDEFKGVPPESFAGGETYHYVRSILADLPRFQGPGQIEIPGSGSGPDALRKAAGRIGTPYSWGGGTPAGPSRGFCDGTNGYLNGSCSASVTEGFDCSSLMQYAYWTSVQLPRVASRQYGATSDRPVAREQLQPGDLLFWSHGGESSIYHVAMYAGDGNVLHAPRTGKFVEVVPLSSAMPQRDYYGATRP
ncbi:NlpC/P60 family protein [Streptomyces sp. NPDC056773]|uniref:C40 family peptidase n=1 Tax=unclassified Streptomyces TaxID=2593676 RepID=UPI0036B31D24